MLGGTSDYSANYVQSTASHGCVKKGPFFIRALHQENDKLAWSGVNAFQISMAEQREEQAHNSSIAMVQHDFCF